MNRVLISLLIHNNGVFSKNGVPFSGVIFEIDVDKSVSGFNVKNGKIGTRYTPICLFEGDNYSEVDLTGQLADYDLVVHDGRPYSGVGYEFFNGHCKREVFLKGGASHREIHWGGANFNMVYRDVPNDKFGESYEWYDGGNLKSINIQTNDKFFGGIYYNSDGELWRFSAQRGLVDNIDFISSNSKYFPNGGVDSVFDHRLAKTLSLGGSDINDFVLDAVLKSKYISNVNILKIDTAKTDNLNVKSLLMRNFKKNFPEKNVFLNGNKVV